tara:strand:+ start:103 stop:363 length:261 start_codon:yes stop_codon:yes gene_type:complete
MKKEKYYEIKKIKVGDSYHHLFRGDSTQNFKHHNPDGPAIQPIGKTSKTKPKWFLHGIEKTQEEFKDFRSSLEGVPWGKNPSMLMK